MNKAVIGGIVAVVIALVGGLGWVMLKKTPEAPVTETPIAPVQPRDNGFSTLTPTKNEIVVQAESAPATPEEIQKKSLDRIVDLARSRDRNRNADYGTQLAAEAFAQAGDLTRAREQIARLKNNAGAIAYFQITPLIELSWRLLQDGKKEEAQQNALLALSKTKGLPKSVRNTQDAATSLAELLFALDRKDDALQLIQQEQDSGPRGQLSALWRTAMDTGTYNIDLEWRRPWHLEMPEPMRMAAVEGLLGHGRIDQALMLAATGDDIASRNACLAAWAARLAQFDAARIADRLEPALAQERFSPAAAVQSWASVSAMAHSLQNATLARSALENATKAIAGLKPTPPITIPSKREIYDGSGKAHAGLADPAPAESAALALANLALARVQQGDAGAWEVFQNAVSAARGMAPSPASTQQLLDECAQNETLVRQELNRILNLGNDVERMRAAFNRYRGQCRQLHAQAQARFLLQVEILRSASIEGLSEQVWKYMLEQSLKPDFAEQEPYLESSLPGLIFGLAQAQGNTTLLEAIQAAYREKKFTPDHLDQVYAQAAHQVAAGDLNQASDTLEREYRSDLAKKLPDRLDRITLALVCRAQVTHPPEAIIPMIQNLYEPVIQEEAFLLLAADSVARGRAAQLWKLTVDSRDLDALEHVSLYRGFVAGVSSRAAATPPAGAAK
jgi:hypothetical protein